MRAFVAIDLPESVRAALARAQATMQAACPHNPDIRWTRADGIHLTLKFLGQISDEQVQAVTTALRRIGAFEEFAVAVKGFGFFPSARHPRVLWAGLDASPWLGELAAKVDRALQKLGFAPEEREFRPHLTLARFRVQSQEPRLEAAIENLGSDSLGSFEVTEYFLFESRLKPGGAEYSKVARFAASAN